MTNICEICQKAPGTVAGEWDDREIMVCADCYEYETGCKPEVSCECGEATGEKCESEVQS